MEPTYKIQKPIVTPPKTQYEFGKTVTFRLRQHSAPTNRRVGDANFSGLWELSKLDTGGRVIEIIEDANALNICFETAQGILENEGY